MIHHKIIKQYLHSISIEQKELTLIKELLIEYKENLQDFLPIDDNAANLFLTQLLQQSLKNYTENKGLIDQILLFHNEKNKYMFYDTLLKSKEGFNLIKDNIYLQKNSETTLKDVIKRENINEVVEYVLNNKQNIQLEILYKLELPLNLITSLENIGCIFDSRIINTINHEINHNNAPEFLKYITKYKDKLSETIWDRMIIGFMNHLENQHKVGNTQYIYKDSIILLLELKNPSNYSWNQKLKNKQLFYDSFSFETLIENFFSENEYKYIYENNDRQKINIKNFIKVHDIQFEKFNETVLYHLGENINPQIVVKLFDDFWPKMFAFENSKVDKWSIIFYDLRVGNTRLLNDRPFIQKLVLKNYFTKLEYRLTNLIEIDLFNQLGINRNDIIYNNRLNDFKEQLSLENVKYILNTFLLDETEQQKVLLDFTIPMKEDKKTNKLKI